MNLLLPGEVEFQRSFRQLYLRPSTTSNVSTRP